MKTTAILINALLSTLFFSVLFAQDMPLVYNMENTGADWPAPYMRTIDELPIIESLPDPFEWSDGRGRIENLSDWRYRRNEIRAEIEHYEIGEKPVRPDDITAGFEDDTLRINITVNGNTLTLTSAVTLPDGAGPFPAMINISSILPSDTLISRGIAIIPYNFGQVMAHTQMRGNEPINALYPDLIYMGAYSAWSWGVSRLIDGLELVSEELPIDIEHLGITGCSFAGKMSLFAGAFDERIALTIAQESGGGGYPAWRVSETLGNVEKLGRTSHAWFIEDMFQFSQAVSKLPHDHHELMAMVAPRALFVTGNPDFEWLADESGHVSSRAAKEVWKALGVPDRFGFSIIAGHGHCAVPNSQIPEIMAFIEKFLLGNNNADTDIATTPYNTDLTPWVTWTTPELSNGSSFLGRTGLIYPPNSRTQLDTAITFQWNQVEGAAKYFFQLSTDAIFQTLIVSDSLTDTTKTVTGLSCAQKYYWRVQIKNGEGSSGPWSELWNFATYITLPSKPQLISAIPSPRQAARVEYEWTAADMADEYVIQVSEDQAFGEIFLSAILSDTDIILTGTVEGQHYFWRVAGSNIGGLGPWSDVRDFTIIIAPTTLKLFQKGSNEISLTWRDHSDLEDGFVVERKKSPDTVFAVFDTLSENVETCVDSTLEQGHTYTYRVKAFKDTVSSFYTDEVSVTLTGINQKDSKPTRYSLSQNYPNPFNPSTKIKFALPKTAKTKITLYDLLGREINVLMNKEVNAGYHEINLDLHNLPGGVYIYRIQSGDFIQSKKLVLMK